MEININVPNGHIGYWKVEDFEITEEAARFENMRAAFKPGSRYVKAGKFKRLMRQNQVIISNTPSEISDHRNFIRQAKKGGHILINGLGLGVALAEILKSEEVVSVTVIEKSEDLIALVGPTYTKDNRVKIINADAYEWLPPRGQRYSAVWHDIWDDICADNLEGMARLHRKYGRRADWQGSWCKELCKRYR